MEYFLVVAGLVLLTFAGDYLVTGSVSIAQKLNVSPLIIGLTVIAFGTSAPELVVGIDAALSGAAGLAIGNVVGSNIANVLLVIGLPAIIYPIACSEDSVKHNLIIMVALTFLFILICYTTPLHQWQGALMLLILFGFLYHSYARSRKEKKLAEHALEDVEGTPEEPLPLPKAIIITILSLIGLAFGADILVDGSITIARNFGISEAVIGLTIVAIGTSLPELITAIMAARKKHSDVAVGNVLGSNIFNLFAIMGATTLVAPVTVPEGFFQLDLWIMAAAAVVLLPFSLMNITIGRKVGFILFGAYVVYLIMLAKQAGL